MYLFHTHRNTAALFGRIALASVFIPHGLDKLLAYEPLGYQGPEAWMAQALGLLEYNWIPPQYREYLALASAWTEVVAGGLCVIGLLVRVAMIPLIINIGAAIALVHFKNGYWIDHTLDGVPAPGFEYHAVLILISLGLLFSGAGSFSIDKLISSEPDFDEYEEDYAYEEYEPEPRHRR